ncbi:MAG: transaldolase, partial [Pseudomonadota bacterium]|nr:transaldolase [Pseudomonadota bacterium]
PELLQKLAESTATLTRKLSPEQAASETIERIILDEKTFRKRLNDDAMASEKLSEGIRAFCVDSEKLDSMIETLRR